MVAMSGMSCAETLLLEIFCKKQSMTIFSHPKSQELHIILIITNSYTRVGKIVETAKSVSQKTHRGQYHTIIPGLSPDCS